MTEVRPKLLTMNGKLDQLLPIADAILAEPLYPDVYAMAEELRELLVDMLACVEKRLDELRVNRKG